MKKFILIMLFAVGMIAPTLAQTTSPVLMPTTIGGTKTVDTTDNTETNYVYYKVPANAKNLSIEVIGTKISGSPNGCFTIEYSVNPASSFSSSNFVALSSADTIHMNNSSTATIGIYQKLSTSASSLPFTYIRVKSVGRGTASYKFQAYFYVKE